MKNKIYLSKQKHVAVEPFEERSAGPSVISGFAMTKGKNSLVKATVVFPSFGDFPVSAGETVWVTEETAEQKFPTYELDGKRFIVLPESHVVLVGELTGESNGKVSGCRGCSCDCERT